MTLGEFNRATAQYGDDTPLVVRTLERGEVCLTVDATSVKVHDGCLLLIGDLDEANGEVH